MNVAAVFFLVVSLLILVSLITLCALHGKKVFLFFSSWFKGAVFKRMVQKDIIGHRQKWRCAHCNGVMLSDFRITTVQNFDYAICLSCSPKYNCVDKACLV